MDDSLFGKVRTTLLFIGAYSFVVATVILGLIGHFFYWLLFEVCGLCKLQTNRKLENTGSEGESEYYAVIVGSGLSGMGTAMKLREIGTDNFLMIERSGSLGGVWQANLYPGLACDVPSILYSFSFAPNPNWREWYARQEEILQYLQSCADKFNIRRHIQFNTTVTKLEWLDERQVWKVITKSNDQEKLLYARFIILGYGPIANPNIPTDIPGIKTFQGDMCHTALWNNKIEFKNKRVVVVGTGASGIQVVPALHKAGVEELIVFQRTARWTVPRPDRPVPEWERKIYAQFPVIQKIVRAFVYWLHETNVLFLTYRLPLRYFYDKLAVRRLQKHVKDPELREKLTPKYDFGCKRVLLSNDWFSTLQQLNVKLVTSGIKEIRSKSVVTGDGREYPVDVIVWSTGFFATQLTINIRGVKGVSIVDEWAGSMRAYRCTTVPKFPNLFFLAGPNTGLGHTSLLTMIEAQIHYISEAMLYMDANNIRAIDVKQAAYDEYNHDLQWKIKDSVWQVGGCGGRFKDAKGNNTAMWPGFTWRFILMMKKFDSGNYSFLS